jgi:hypothetical protein
LSRPALAASVLLVIAAVGENPDPPGNTPAVAFSAAADTVLAVAVTNFAKGDGGRAILVLFPCYTLFILGKMCYYISTRGTIDDNYTTTKD